METTVFDITAITKALVEANSFVQQIMKDRGFELEGDLEWTAINQQQVLFMNRYQAVSAELANFKELEAWARWTAEEINAILEERGFTIRLDPWDNDGNNFGVAAIYDLSIKWKVIGTTEDEETGLAYQLPNGKPAFHLPTKDAGLEFYELDERIIIKIPGEQEGDALLITRAYEPVADFGLLHLIEVLNSWVSKTHRIWSYGGLIAPNILFDSGDDWDISWLKGLYAHNAGGVWEVAQAKAQAKFAMGPEGARAKVAVATHMAFESFIMVAPDYIVDHDVIIWMQRKSVSSEPLFCAYVPMSEFADYIVSLSEID